MPSGRLTEPRGGLQPPASRTSGSGLSSADQIVPDDPDLFTLSVSSSRPVLRNTGVLEITAGCSPVKHCQFYNRVCNRMNFSSEYINYFYTVELHFLL